jgi:putative photosynthetic complex assembly protein
LSSLDERPFPAGALYGAMALVLTTTIGVGVIQAQKRVTDNASAVAMTDATAVETRTLRFADQHDGVSVYGGHVRVFDADTGAELPQLRDRDGFVRAVLNSLAYERTKRDVNAPPVFDLVRWSDKQITISDKATGARINIGDFGPGNKAVWLRFFRQADAHRADAEPSKAKS